MLRPTGEINRLSLGSRDLIISAMGCAPMVQGEVKKVALYYFDLISCATQKERMQTLRIFISYEVDNAFNPEP